MPTKDEHVTWAAHDRAFRTSFDLSTTPFVNWVVTGIFYEAVHWVEAFLATKGYNSGSHRQRSWAMLLFVSELGPIQTDYDTLKLDSEKSRYECYEHTGQQVREELVPLLNSIKSHISALLQARI